MQHFDSEKWADFVRGVVEADTKTEMQTHLDTGCKQCQRMAELWQRINQAARRQQLGELEPPESVVRTVKGLYALHGPRRKGAPAVPAIASLLFDSLCNPLPAGVRSAASASRQLLFGSGDLRIDLRIDPQDDTEKISLVGQILDAADPAAKLGSAQVALWRGHRVLAETLTNEFGEFHLECQLEPRFELRVSLPGQPHVCVPLVDPAGSSTAVSFDVLASKQAEVKEVEGKAKKKPRKKV
jgi:hypothetical protein